MICSKRQASDRAYYLANKDERCAYVRAYKKANRLRLNCARMGTTVEWYERTLHKQRGKCAICRTDNPGAVGGKRRRFWCIDHDHKTGEVRGLLCNNCNAGLGLLGDSTKNLGRAIQYLNL